MKHWGGKDFKYRGFEVHNNKKEKFLEVYKDNQYCFRVDSFGRGSVTSVKVKIDMLIKNQS